MSVAASRNSAATRFRSVGDKPATDRTISLAKTPFIGADNRLQTQMHNLKLLHISIFLSLLLLTGCTSTINRADQMRPGMTRAEVIDTLGHPYQTLSPYPNEEILRYNLKKQRLYRLAVPLTTEYMVRLIEGHVISYGAERELQRLERPVVIAAPKNEKTINLNIKTDGNTNTVAPVQPRINVNTD